ncbi:MAG: thioredoxin fold domain-containing protein [Hyphomicrobiaceae bacterium]
MRIRRWVLVAALLALPLTPSRAARDLALPETATQLELVVFERAGCLYCEVFHRDVLPRYKASLTAAQAPLRFVDITAVDVDRLALRASITTIPTVVLMKDGQEVDRIVGYTGPETFFQLVAHMLGRAE